MTDQARADAAAAFLIALRDRDAVLAEAFPDDLRPRNTADVVAIQLATLKAIGPVGGWKVGAHDATAEPTASPLPASGIVLSPAAVASRRRGVECEISFRFGRGLSVRDEPYERNEVLAAIDSCQAAIEIVSSRFSTHPGLEPLSLTADLSAHDGLCIGQRVATWSPDMFGSLPIVMSIDGAEQAGRVGSNPAGDLVRLLVWLANSDVVRAAGGIAEGAVVTTGSWTGLKFVEPGTTVMARFEGFPPVEVLFERP